VWETYRHESTFRKGNHLLLPIILGCVAVLGGLIISGPNSPIAYNTWWKILLTVSMDLLKD
jgi:hypothetical protein